MDFSSWMLLAGVTACFSGTKEGPSRGFFCFILFNWNYLCVISHLDSEFSRSEAAAAHKYQHKPSVAHLEQIEMISHLPLGRFLGNWAKSKAHQTLSLHWFSCSLTPCRGLHFLFVSKLNRPVNWRRADFTTVGFERSWTRADLYLACFEKHGKHNLWTISYRIILSLQWPLRWVFIKN